MNLKYVLTAPVLVLGAAISTRAQSNLPQFISPKVTAGEILNIDYVEPNGQVIANAASERFNSDGTLDGSFSLPPSSDVGGGAEIMADSKGNLILGNNLGLLLFSPSGKQIGTLYRTSVPFLVAPDDSIFLWGTQTFTASAVTTNGITHIKEDGTLVAPFNLGSGPNGGAIRQVVLQADGKALVSGDFTSFSGSPTSTGLVRLNTDGSVDTSFQPPPGPQLFALAALPSGKILVYGGFPTANYWLNADGSYASLSAVVSGAVYLTVAVQPDGRLIAGGHGGTLVRLNADLSVDTTFVGSSTISEAGITEISYIGVSPSGAIYVYNGQGKYVRLNPDGTPDGSFAPGTPASGAVLATTRGANGDLYLLGKFYAINGTPEFGCAAIHPDGSTDTSFRFTSNIQWIFPANDEAFTSATIVQLGDGSLLIAGTFSGVGSVGKFGIAHVLVNGDLDTSFSPTLNPGAQVLAVNEVNNLWIIGGTFYQVNGANRSFLAAFSSSGTALDPSFGVASATDDSVTAIVRRPTGGVFVAGNFAKIGPSGGSLARHSLAALNADGTVDPSFDATPTLGNNIYGISCLTAAGDGGAILGAFGGSLYRFGPTGSVATTTFSPPAFVAGQTISEVYPPVFASVVLDPSGDLYALVWEDLFGGNGSIASGGHWGICRFLPSGQADPSFPFTDDTLTSNGYLTAEVTSVAPNANGGLTYGSDNLLTACGVFTGIGGSDNMQGVVLIPNPGASISAPVITQLFIPDAVREYGSTNMSVTATGTSLTYQWYEDGYPLTDIGAVHGSTTPNLTVSYFTPYDAGSFYVVVTNSAGSATSATVQVVAGPDARLVNLSARAHVGTGGDILIAGFVITGVGSKQVLLRGVGPSLQASPFSVSNTLLTPQLTLVSSSTNSDLVTAGAWGGSTQLSTDFIVAGAFALPQNSADAAVSEVLPAGGYTSEISGIGSTTGIALAEVYDSDVNLPLTQLENVSARANIGTGGNILIAGFVIQGGPLTILLRGVGPTLGSAPFNVPGALPGTTISLFDSKGNLLASQSGWSNPPVVSGSITNVRAATAADFAHIGAFALPASSADSAFLIVLPPGAYTLQVASANGATGVGLAEVYNFL